MEYLSVILSSIAVIVALFTFLFLYMLPAKFIIEHITKNKKSANTYEHIITIVNIRNTTGILKGIEPKTLSKDAGVERGIVQVIWGAKLVELNEDPPYAVVSVGSKESIIIKCYVKIIDYTEKRIIPEYKIKLTLDKKTKYFYDEKDKNLDVGYTFSK